MEIGMQTLWEMAGFNIVAAFPGATGQEYGPLMVVGVRRSNGEAVTAWVKRFGDRVWDYSAYFPVQEGEDHRAAMQRAMRDALIRARWHDNLVEHYG
jgi:hypothetical protein